jgi:hypothetical protein
MCEHDKNLFVESIEKVKDSIRKLEKPFKFNEIEEFTLAEALNKYGDDVSNAKMGDATPEEMASNKAHLNELDAANKKAIKHAKTNGEKAMALKAELIK